MEKSFKNITKSNSEKLNKYQIVTKWRDVFLGNKKLIQLLNIHQGNSLSLYMKISYQVIKEHGNF